MSNYDTVAQNYDTFVQRIVNIETPSLELILAARQQFIDECDENVLQNQLLEALDPFIDQVTDKEVSWWGLIMCSLFEIHHAAKQLGVCDGEN